jgi:hypothetical protein
MITRSFHSKVLGLVLVLYVQLYFERQSVVASYNNPIEKRNAVSALLLIQIRVHVTQDLIEGAGAFLPTENDKLRRKVT